MSWEKIQKLALNWDRWLGYKLRSTEDSSMPLEPVNALKNKEAEYRHSKLMGEIKFLAESLFYTYNQIGSRSKFEQTFSKWLDNFDDLGDFDPNSIGLFGSPQDERRFAFYLARQIVFFTGSQMFELMETVSNKIRLNFVKDLMEQGKIKPYDVSNLINHTGQIHKESLFTQLSADARGDEFRRHFLPYGSVGSKYYIDLLELLNSYISCNNEEKINEFTNGKKYLIVLDDFSGSGTKFYYAIEEIINSEYFETIIFCPYIITNGALNYLNKVKKLADGKEKKFKIFWGLKVDDRYSVDYESNQGVDIYPRPYWGAEKDALKRISNDYHTKFFLRRKSLKSNGEPTPYGWKNGGYPLVIYNNCPNNSLPILWCQDPEKNFKPLFLRSGKYGDEDEPQ